jgi:hypothetical protein
VKEGKLFVMVTLQEGNILMPISFFSCYDV